MNWIDIGAFDADLRYWTFSQPITANLIKIQNSVLFPQQVKKPNFKGLIALTFDYKKFFQTQEFFSIEDEQLILFQDLDIGLEKRLAIRNISRYNNNAQWTVNAFVWDEIINPYVPTVLVDEQSISSNLSNDISQNLTDNLTQNLTENLTESLQNNNSNFDFRSRRRMINRSLF